MAQRRRLPVIFRSTCLRRLAAAVLTLGALASGSAAAAPVLTSAQATIRFESATSCEVSLTLVVSGSTDIEHRLELLEGASVELLEVRDAALTSAPRDLGRTRVLQLAPSVPGGNYTFRYRVTQTPARPNRCPVWLPTAPAGGRSRDVRLVVDVPAGTVASGTMPTFTWSGSTGTAVVPHLPAFVIVPFVAADAARPWDVSRVMDAAAILTLVGASALWLRRQNGQHG